jgi:hypothetical protein
MNISSIASLLLVGLVTTSGCAAGGDGGARAEAVRDDGGTTAEAAVSADPFVLYLEGAGFPVRGGVAALPAGSFDTALAFPVRVRHGRPVLPPGFVEPEGGFASASPGDAALWVASVISTIPGRDRADVIGLAPVESVPADALRFAEGLVEVAGPGAVVLTNMNFAGGWSDVNPDGALFQGAVLVLGARRGVLVYADATD